MKFRFGPFTLDPDSAELHGAEGPVEVEPQVFALLTFLVENADRIVTKDEIIDAVWDGRIVSDASLNSRINAARRAVGDDGKAQAVIRTYPRRGYRFVAEVEGAAPDAPLAVDGRSRVAVLPLRTYSEDPALRHFADALSEDVIAELSHSRLFLTLSYAATRALKDEPDVQTLGREHQVRYVVEGGVRQMGHRLRISAALSETETGGVLWTEQFLRDDEDVFAVEEDIAARVVSAVEPVIQHAERRRAVAAERPGAWEYYLRGWHHLHNDGPIGEEMSSRRAAETFRAALALAPDFAAAHAGLGTALWQLAAFNLIDDRDALYEQALAHARRAVDLDDGNAETHGVLGITLAHMGRAREAISALRRALTLYPSNSQYRRWLGIALVASGDTGAAIRTLDEVIESGGADAGVGPSYAWSGLARVLDGRYAEAEPFAREAVENPKSQLWANVGLILSLQGQGRAAEAAEEVAALLDFKPGLTCAWVARLTSIADPTLRARMLDGLAAAGLPD